MHRQDLRDAVGEDRSYAIDPSVQILDEDEGERDEDEARVHREDVEEALGVD